MTTNHTNRMNPQFSERAGRWQGVFVSFVWFVVESSCAYGVHGNGHIAPHILNTPKRVSGIGAFSEAEMERPRTSRVWAGSMMPSSQSRAVAK